ncbi:MAG: hypothetical protein BWY74_03489 [Firmicutes bacterium ADurb.Bin419]|nr:MAG: hypothetical protein BWY74_03489 [Firmicutes bacterium ADurb.Bin419]
MDIGTFFIGGILALIGGCLGASVSALGGFVLLGLFGIAGFLFMFITGDSTWSIVIASSVLLKPSSCFIGGVISTAYARKKALLKCGKDIGRSLITFHKFSIILVGGIAGLSGYLLNYVLDRFLSEKIDTTALTVMIMPLIIKYLWKMTKTSDCSASSHAVPSPYRFFERISSNEGKVVTSIIVGFVTALVTLLLMLNKNTAPFAGAFMFYLSALSLYFVFMGIPIPATHHFSGTAGTITAYWLSLNGNNTDIMPVITMILWGIAAAMIGLVSSEILGKFFFNEGDIHVDPPAMGIMFTTGILVGILPLTGVYHTDLMIQSLICVVLITGLVISKKFTIQ